MTQYVPLIAPALWRLHATHDFSLIDISEPDSLPGWQQITLRRNHPEVGPGSSILVITVMPSGVTQVLDPYMLVCGLFTSFAAALHYIVAGLLQWEDSGLTVDFPQSP